MPLSFQTQLNDAAKIGVWHITESEEFFLREVPPQREITHPHKRLQHLAGRFLLRTLSPDFPIGLIKIADTRKPFLADASIHFSISHCGNYAAAIVSSTNRVGVDIEVPQEKIKRIRQKFLSPEEEVVLLASGDDAARRFTLAWSVKEAIFKWFGEGELDFRGHMEIKKITNEGEVFQTVCAFKKNNEFAIEVMSLQIEENILSYIVT